MLDAWVRFTTRGTLHFLFAEGRTTPCGVPAREPVERLNPDTITKLPDYDRPPRCPACLTAARKVGHK